MTIFHLPDLGEGLAEAQVRTWYIKQGDAVTRDQPLLSVETAKAVVDIPSPYTGHIVTLHAEEDTMVQTGAPLITFQLEIDKTAPDQATVVGKLEETTQILAEEKAPSPSAQNTSASSGTSIKASPRVRARARALNLDLRQITPTAHNQSITLDDVERYAAQQGSPSSEKSTHLAVDTKPSRVESLTGAGRSMAQILQKAHSAVVPTVLFDDADITARCLTSGETSPTPLKCHGLTVKLMRAIEQAVLASPNLNAHYDATRFERNLFKSIHLGIAIDSPKGLFVPVIHHLERYNDRERREQLNQLKQLAEQSAFSPDRLHHATLTLSNIGTIAGRYATPTVVPPTVAIIAVGRSTIQPVWDTKQQCWTPHLILPLSLSFDHRAITGAEAAHFLKALIDDLEQPDTPVC